MHEEKRKIKRNHQDQAHMKISRFFFRHSGKVVMAMVVTTILISGSGCSSMTADVHSDVSDQSEKPVLKEKDFVWVKEPGSLDIDSFRDLDVKGGNLRKGYTESTGYGPSWLEKSYTGNAILVEKDQKYGIYDFDGNVVQPVQYGSVSGDFSRNRYVYSSVEGGEPEGSFRYDFNLTDTPDFGSYQDDSNTGYAFITGDEYFPGSAQSENACQTDSQNVNFYTLEDSPDPVILPVKNNATCNDAQSVITDPDGFEIRGNFTDAVKIPAGMTPVYYPDFTKDENSITDNINTCFVNGVVKLLDQKGKIHLWDWQTQKYVSSESFSDATYFENGYAGVRKNGGWAFMDRNGKLITNYIFDQVSGLYDGKAYVTENGKPGILNLKESLKKKKFPAEKTVEFAPVTGTVQTFTTNTNSLTSFRISDDGTVYGRHYDIVSAGNTVQTLCEFKAKFTDLQKTDSTTYQMALTDVQALKNSSDNMALNSVEYHFTDSNLLPEGVYTVYLPGTPLTNTGMDASGFQAYGIPYNSDHTTESLLVRGPDNQLYG